MEYEPIPAELDRIGKIIVDAAFRVHSTLGPGLLEKVYQVCLAYELEKRGLRVRREAPVDIVYDTIRVQEAYRTDLLVEESVTVEVKAEKDHPVFFAQAMTHVRLSGHRLGYLINFHCVLIKDGIRRIAM
jgi:GxxExxY protein